MVLCALASVVFQESSLQGTNISNLGKGKNHLQKCLGRGYVSSLEGIPQIARLLTLANVDK